MQGWGQVGQLGVQKYNADVNAYNATQAAGGASSQGFGQFAGMLGATALKKYG
jgi:hypothetical protein